MRALKTCYAASCVHADILSAWITLKKTSQTFSEGDTQWTFRSQPHILYMLQSFSLCRQLFPYLFITWVCVRLFACDSWCLKKPFFFVIVQGAGVPIPSMSSAVPAQSQTGNCREDRYAALAELDNELSSSASTGSNVHGWETEPFHSWSYHLSQVIWSPVVSSKFQCKYTHPRTCLITQATIGGGPHVATCSWCCMNEN